MAIKLVLAGIAAGLAATAGVIALGGGVGTAVLAYVGGGMAGMIGGLAAELSSGDAHDIRGALVVTADQPRSHPRPVSTTHQHG